MSIKNGQYAVSNFHWEIDGKSAGYLSSFQAPSYEVEDISQSLGPDYVSKKMMGAPKVGEFTAVFNIAQAGEALRWMQTVWDKKCIDKNLVIRLSDQDYNIKRGVDMTDCTITKIEWPELKASDGKKHFEVTLKGQPQALKYQGGGGKNTSTLGQKAKAWMVNNFEVQPVFGLKTQFVTSATLPGITAKISKEYHGKFRLPVLQYSAIEFATLKLEIGAAGFQEAQNLAVRIIQDGHCDEGEFQDVLIHMKNQKLDRDQGIFTMIGCGLKKFDWAPKLEGGKEGLAVCTLEFMVEDFRFELKAEG